MLESLMVVAVVVVLSAVMFPSLSGARSAARLTSCAAQLRQIGAGLTSYTVDARHRLPPFIFSEPVRPSLPLSGHYGGDGPETGIRQGDRDVNLHALRRDGTIHETQLICPGASVNLQKQQAGCFAQGKSSTYCLRMPYSVDLWPAQTPPPKFGALDAYRYVAGGQTARSPLGVDFLAPQLRVDARYASLTGGGTFVPGSDAIVSDMFVDQAYRDAAGRTERGWCHDGRFNVLRGSGAVRQVRDDDRKTIVSNSSPPGTTQTVDNEYNAASAEAVWQLFDTAGR